MAAIPHRRASASDAVPRLPRAVAALALALAPLGAAGAGGELAGISPFATLGKLLAALALVLVVFWVSARLLRLLPGLRGGTAPGALRVVGALPLGHRERLVVVQAGEEQLLLGVTASRIERLHLLAAPIDAPARGETGDAGGEFGRRLLAALLRDAASTRRSPVADAPRGDAP